MLVCFLQLWICLLEINFPILNSYTMMIDDACFKLFGPFGSLLLATSSPQPEIPQAS